MRKPATTIHPVPKRADPTVISEEAWIDAPAQALIDQASAQLALATNAIANHTGLIFIEALLWLVGRDGTLLCLRRSRHRT